MALTQDDIELLEMHLDGALSQSDVESLTHRLSTSADLSAALDELRSQRALRAAVWSTFEPDEMAARQLAWRVRGAMVDRKQTAFSGWSLSRWGSAVAACIVLGFFGGWLGRGNHAGPVQGTNPTGESYVINQPAAAPGTPVFAPVTNEYGQIVAWQPFQNKDDANHFIEDLNRVHAPAAGTPLDDKINLTSYEKTEPGSY